MTIEILNLRDTKPTEPYDFCIDRRSPVGNPFEMATEEDRDKVCDYFEDYHHKMIEAGRPEYIAYINEMLKAYSKSNKIRLFCWCVPKRCHGETIRTELLNFIEYNNGELLIGMDKE